MKFGRKRSAVLAPHLKFRNYIRKALPSPSSSADYSPKALPSLTDIMGNDALGDCVIAGANHILGVETGNAGDFYHTANADILAQYSAIGGYVPGDPSTDNGCELQTALAYYQTHGFSNGTKLLGWLAIDATNAEEVAAACYLFENLYFGIELPDPWVSPFPSANGFVWDMAPPDAANGHCVAGVGYDTSGVKIDTWGLLGTLTYKAIAGLCTSASGGELYVMLTPDQLTKGQTKAPNGVNWSAIIGDFDSLGGTVPIPAPPAPPPPVPSPTAPPTLAQAQAACVSALNALHPLITRSQAVTAVNRALIPLWPKP